MLKCGLISLFVALTSEALYCKCSPVGGEPLELLELLEPLELLELLELAPLLELLEFAEPLELELELSIAPLLLLELPLPPVPPEGVSRLLRSGSTPYAHAASITENETNIALFADTTFNHRVLMSRLTFYWSSFPLA